MAEDARVESVMEACVNAGAAALRAHAAALKAREQAALGGARLTPDDVERLNNGQEARG